MLRRFLAHSTNSIELLACKEMHSGKFFAILLVRVQVLGDSSVDSMRHEMDS